MLELVKSSELDPKNGLARVRNWRINGKSLQTPIILPSYWTGATPKPWEVHPEISAVLLSGYDIVNKKKVHNSALEVGLAQTLEDLYGLRKDMVLMLDSGGFSLLRASMKKQKEEFNFDKFSKWAAQDYLPKLTMLIKKGNPDLAVTLDFPIDPSAADMGKRVAFTIKHLTSYLKDEFPPCSGHPSIVPVVHPISGVDIENSMDRFLIEDKGTRLLLENAETIGLGSLVPLMLTTKGAALGKQRAIESVMTVRREFEEKFFHTFGIAGTTSIHLMFYLGTDSLDSNGWRIRASFNIVQLSGTGDRYFSKERQQKRAWKSIKVLSPDERRRLESCGCPACSQIDRVEELDSNFHLLATHNLYTYIEELKEAQNHIEMGDYGEFVEQRLENSKYMLKLFKLSKEKLHQSKLTAFG